MWYTFFHRFGISNVKVTPNLYQRTKKVSSWLYPNNIERAHGKMDCLNNLMGSGIKGNSDRIASSWQLYQPNQIFVEFDNVVYFTDCLTASVKITSTLSLKGTFPEAVGKLMKAYLTHEKNTAWKVSKHRVISGPYFPAFGLNMEIHSANLRVQSEYRKTRARNNSVFGHFSRSETVG